MTRADVRITVVRHAPPVEPGVCYGRTEVEVSLDPETTASTILHRLSDTRAFHTVWTSPARRCAEPARVLSRRLALPLSASKHLRELDFGAWEGIAWADLERHQSVALRQWADHWQTEAPPQGETIADLTQRVKTWLTDLPSGEHLVITHAGVVRALRVLLAHQAWDRAMAEPVAYLEPVRLVTSAM